MKFALANLMAWIALVVRGEMKKCPPEFSATIKTLQAEDPEWIACYAEVEKHKRHEQSAICPFDACRRAAQHIYDIFPENCEVEGWVRYDENNTRFLMTKKHYASLAYKNCNWDLENAVHA